MWVDGYVFSCLCLNCVYGWMDGWMDGYISNVTSLFFFMYR